MDEPQGLISKVCFPAGNHSQTKNLEHLPSIRSREVPFGCLVQRTLTDAPAVEELRDQAQGPAAKLEILRLTREEMAFQPVPLLSALTNLTAATLDGVPRLRQSGPFGAFTAPPATSDQQWVVRTRIPLPFGLNANGSRLIELACEASCMCRIASRMSSAHSYAGSTETLHLVCHSLSSTHAEDASCVDVKYVHMRE